MQVADRKPIRLHLDTSDYAAMYNAVPGSAIIKIRDTIYDMVQQGRILTRSLIAVIKWRRKWR